MTDHWDGTHPEDVLTDAAEWHVLVEETVGGREGRWTLTKTLPCKDQDDARRRAHTMAGGYQPEHPMSPRGRRVFQIGDDTWLVRVSGVTSEFHFRLSVGRLRVFD